MVNIHGNEFHLSRNAILILVVIQITALIFAAITLQSLSGVNCSPTTGFNIQNVNASTSAICRLQLQTSAITNTTNSIANSFTCAQHPSLAMCTIGATLNGGNTLGIPNSFFYFIIQFVNGAIGALSFLGNAVYLFLQFIYLMIFILGILFPSLFSTGVFEAFGTLVGILLSGALLLAPIYLIYLAINRLPWFGKH